MDIYVLNKSFETYCVIDDYISLVWTERYSKPGDFSLEIPGKYFKRYSIQPDYYLWRKDTKTLMVVEYIRLVTDTVAGNTILIKGRSMESFLDRRIAMGRLQFDGTAFTYLVRMVILNNVTKCPLELADFPDGMDKLRFTGEFQGETLLDILEEVCDEFGYGFSFRPEKSFTTPTLRIYNGVDRSWKQTENPWVVYSPKLDTIATSEFVYDITEKVTSFVICGEAESQTINPTNGDVYEWPQVWLRTKDPDHSGWEIREAFLDGSGISRWQGDYILGTFEPKDPEDVTHGWKKLGAAFYEQLLLAKTERQRKKIIEDSLKFEAEMTAASSTQWVLGEDILMGDIVQVVNELGIQARCRVTEMTLSEDRNGIKFYPTFKSLDNKIENGGIIWPSPSASTTRSTMIGCTTRPNL